MIHFSFVEGFSSPPNNGLLLLGVEGSVALKNLISDYIWHPWVLCLWEILRFGFEKEEDKEKQRKEKQGEGGSSFSFLYFGQLLFSL